MIQFEHVSKHYGDTPILEDLSFTVPDGQFLVLIGPSGCGKTTSLKMINRLLEPDSGRILIDGEDIAQLNPVQLRRRIGYVIQQIGLFPNMTVEQNICVVPKLLKYSKAQCAQLAREYLEMVELPYEQYAHKYPNELSGGQQQRIGVLRALAASPPVVLMDEPFSALDPMTREVLQDEVKRLQRKLHKTIVFVSHDMDEALKLADIIMFMNKAKSSRRILLKTCWSTRPRIWYAAFWASTPRRNPSSCGWRTACARTPILCPRTAAFWSARR